MKYLFLALFLVGCTPEAEMAMASIRANQAQIQADKYQRYQDQYRYQQLQYQKLRRYQYQQAQLLREQTYQRNYQRNYCDYNKAVVISLSNGAGEFYTCEGFQKTRQGPASGGVPGKFDTPKGSFWITHQLEKHDSTLYPSDYGRNMDFSSFFVGGVALHQGSVRHWSHGCVHLRKTDARYIYNNFNKGDLVIVKDK